MPQLLLPPCELAAREALGVARCTRARPTLCFLRKAQGDESPDKPLPSMKTTKVELNLLVDSFSSRSNVLFPSISSSEMPSSS